MSSLNHSEVEATNPEARFDKALIESVEETVGAILGLTVIDAFRYHLYAYLGLSREDIPSHLNELSSVLSQSFGVAGPVLGRAMVRRLSAKLGLSLVQYSNTSLVESIDEMKRLYLAGGKNSC